MLSGRAEADFGIFGPGVNNVMIMNGFIEGFKNPAIIGHDAWIVENMRIAYNNYGIKLENYARVLRSTITWNAAYAINCGNYCHVEGMSSATTMRLSISIQEQCSGIRLCIIKPSV